MEFDIDAAVNGIVEKFNAEGDFEFMKPEELKSLTETLVTIDFAYMDEIGEDGVYDEDVVYERLYKKATEDYEQYKTYLMRFVDDYMDFMEEYLVSIGAIEWE